MSEKEKKLNPLKAYLKRRQIQKKRKQFFEASIKKDKYPVFLKEVDKAIQDLLRDIPDASLFLDKMGEEAARWINEIPSINLASFKAGTCYGIYVYCKLKKELEGKKENYIV